MLINQVNLDAAFTGFKTIFQAAIDTTPTTYEQIATTTTSNTSREVYPWLGATTKFRQWLGDRVIQGLGTHAFTIVNEHYENTVGINRDQFEDDTYGIYQPIIAQMGQDTKSHPDILIYNLLQAATSTLCYDQTPFFGADHPGWDVNANPIQVSNYSSGGGNPPWYLLDCSRAVKPLIFQMRKPYLFVPRTRPDDPAVFDRNEFLYGVDARVNVGVGLWQLAYCSTQPLNSANYAAARAAMMSIRQENGDLMAVMPDTLLVGPSNEGLARTLLLADIISQTSNIWKGSAKLLVTPRLP